MAVKCSSCHKTLKNIQGLSLHRRKCPKAVEKTIALLKQLDPSRQQEASASGSGVSDNHDAEQSRDVHILFLSTINTDLLLTSMMLWM
jgi:hypothetical protein